MDERSRGQADRPHNWRKVDKPSRRGSGGRIAVLGGLVIVLLLGALIAYGEYAIRAPQGSSSAAEPFQVRSGDTVGKVATRLQDDGLLHDSLLFRIEARILGMGAKLRVGTFILRRNMSIDQMISALTTDPAHMIAITIPPGWRSEQIAAELRAHGISGRQFLRAVRHPGFGLDFPAGWPRRHSLEGFLFPDTYLVDPGTSGGTFARIMVRRFEQVVGRHMLAVARRAHRSMYHIVIMASIVEREDRFPSQKRIIASVYYNRLRIGMPLQSDPTVQYGLGRPRDWWPPITVADHTAVHSPENTYRRRGFPAHPIANPDLSSIRAALHPAHTHYYYFAGKGSSGYLFFTTTYAQFEAGLRRYG